jgi:hypothetical protein
MRDMSSGSTQDFHLAVVDMNAMRKHDMRPSQPAGVQVLYVTESGFALDDADLILILGSVSVNHHPALTR